MHRKETQSRRGRQKGGGGAFTFLKNAKDRIFRNTTTQGPESPSKRPSLAGHAEPTGGQSSHGASSTGLNRESARVQWTDASIKRVMGMLTGFFQNGGCADLNCPVFAETVNGKIKEFGVRIGVRTEDPHNDVIVTFGYDDQAKTEHSIPLPA